MKENCASLACNLMTLSTVWTWGRAKNYRLGRDVLGHDARVPEPVRGFEAARIQTAACGGGHTAVVRDDGALFVFGYSQYGQLGLGDRTDMCVPTFVSILPSSLAVDPEKHLLKFHPGVSAGVSAFSDISGYMVPRTASGLPVDSTFTSFRDPQFLTARVVDVCCGRYHTIAMTADGAVYTWGGGKNGRLGHGDEKIRLHPGCVETLLPHRAVAITAGYHNNLVLTERGDVWSWGWGAHGQLGTGDTRDREVPTLIDELSGLGVVSLSCGDRHSFAVTSDGTVYGWGSNEFGQLGIGRRGDTLVSPTTIPALAGLFVTALSSGDRHSAAVTNIGAVYTWGCGIDGQCGHGDFEDVSRPRMVRALSHLFVASVHCGHNFTMVATDEGEIYAWGNNTYGQLGNGGSGKSPVPVRVHVPGAARVSKVVCAHFHCVLMTEVASEVTHPKSRDEFALSQPEPYTSRVSAVSTDVAEAGHESNSDGRQKSLANVSVSADGTDDAPALVGKSSDVAAANDLLQSLLEQYHGSLEKVTGDSAFQSYELLIADILRLSTA